MKKGSVALSVLIVIIALIVVFLIFFAFARGGFMQVKSELTRRGTEEVPEIPCFRGPVVGCWS